MSSKIGLLLDKKKNKNKKLRLKLMSQAGPKSVFDMREN